MAKESKIAWTEATQNFWVGCKKVSAGCSNCYMFNFVKRTGKNPDEIRRTKDATFNAPLKWKTPKIIFTCSLSDFFIEEADLWRKEAWDIIRKTQHHKWLILTKRPERIIKHLPDDFSKETFPNVWFGVSVCTKRDIDKISALNCLGWHNNFVSCEPLLEYINFQNCDFSNISWVIIGGESGGNARMCKTEWIENMIFDLRKKPLIFVKQLGSAYARENKLSSYKGEDINEFPKELQIQQSPFNLEK